LGDIWPRVAGSPSFGVHAEIVLQKRERNWRQRHIKVGTDESGTGERYDTTNIWGDVRTTKKGQRLKNVGPNRWGQKNARRWAEARRVRGQRIGVKKGSSDANARRGFFGESTRVVPKVVQTARLAVKKKKKRKGGIGHGARLEEHKDMKVDAVGQPRAAQVSDEKRITRGDVRESGRVQFFNGA